MKILSSRRFALWWQLAMGWFIRLRDEAVAAIIAALPKEASEEDIDSLFENGTD